MSENHVSIYQGWRDDEGIHILANDRPLRHVMYHNPTGFEWGYGGSGPADLALSILAHYFKERHLNTAYLKKIHSDLPRHGNTISNSKGILWRDGKIDTGR